MDRFLIFARHCPTRDFTAAAWAMVIALLCCCNISSVVADDSVLADQRSVVTTFIIVRHAERDGNKDVLTDAGKDRANTLLSLSKTLNATVVYSTNTARTVNTVKPLADELELKINLYGRAGQAWVDSLKEQHAGEVVVIVGHSNTTGVIAGLLASEPPFPIGHDEYDSMFIVTVDESKTSCVRLKYGSTSTGAVAADADKMAPAINHD